MSASYELSLITRYFGGVGMHAIRAGIIAQAEKAAAASASGLARSMVRGASTDRLPNKAAAEAAKPAAPKPQPMPSAADQELIDVLFARPHKRH